jgi:hypothetical protein
VIFRLKPKNNIRFFGFIRKISWNFSVLAGMRDEKRKRWMLLDEEAYLGKVQDTNMIFRFLSDY